MKKLLLISFLLIALGNKALAQSAGFNNTFIVLSVNNSLNLYYDLNGNTSNYDFDGQQLGSFCQESQDLIFKGGENNIWKCGGCDLSATALYYRIYVTGTTPGAFVSNALNYNSGNNNGCGGADQKWDKVNFNVNLLNGLGSGNYTFEVYCQGNTTCNSGAIYASNNGNNFKAYFTVNAASVGGMVSSGQTICNGNTPAGLSLSGHTGNVIKWQRSTTADFSANVIDIANTTATLTGTAIGALTQTTYFRAVVQSNQCSQAFSGIAAITVGDNTWTGAQDTAWSTANNWTCGVPTATQAVVIPLTANKPVLSAGIVHALSLTLQSDAKLTIAPGATLQVENAINIDATATLIVQNNAGLVQVNNTTNSGAATVMRNSNPLYRLDYTLWGSPVAAQQLQSFSENTLSNRFYSYAYNWNAAGTSPSYREQYFAANVLDNFTPGKAYLIRTPDFVTGDAGYTAGTSTYVHNGAFSGVLNNGTVAVPTTVTSLNGGGVLSQSGHYIAVANPYPSPISVKEFFAQNSAVIEAGNGIYFWRKKNGGQANSYAHLSLMGYTTNGPIGGSADDNSSYYGGNNSGSSAFNDAWIISPAQGFLVKLKSGLDNTAQITFTNSMRKPAQSSQPFLKTSNTNDAPAISRLWLNIQNSDSSAFSQAAVGYLAEGTLGLDYGYDAKILGDGNAKLYSKEAGENFAIQARPGFIVTDVVPMGFVVATAGQYTISLDHADGIFSTGQQVYLKDNLLGSVTNLNESGYVFTTDSGTFDSRFEVVYLPQGHLETEVPALANSVMVYQQNSTINIDSALNEITHLAVYDILGRKLYGKNNVNATHATITSLSVTNNVVVVEVSTANGKVCKKIVL